MKGKQVFLKPDTYLISGQQVGEFYHKTELYWCTICSGWFEYESDLLKHLKIVDDELLCDGSGQRTA